MPSRGRLPDRLRGRRASSRSSLTFAGAVARAPDRRDGDARRPRRAQRADADARRRGDVRRASSSRSRVASQIDQFHEMFDGSSEPLGILLAAGVMFVVGAIDDLRDVSPPAKIAGQVLAGSLLSLFGVTMLYFRVPFASYDVHRALARPRAAASPCSRVVVLANAINLIDGLDGLAAGIVVDRRHRAVPLRRPAVQGRLPRRLQHRAARRGDHRRRSASGSCRTTSTRRGSSWATPARCSSACCSRSRRSRSAAAPPTSSAARRTSSSRRCSSRSLILGVPIVDTAFSFVRRVVRGASRSSHGRPGAPAPPADAPRPRSAALGRDPVALDRAALGRRAAPDLHRPGQRARADRGRCALALLLYSYFHPGVQGGPGRSCAEEPRPRPPRRRRGERPPTRSSTSSPGAAPAAGSDSALTGAGGVRSRPGSGLTPPGALRYFAKAFTSGRGRLDAPPTGVGQRRADEVRFGETPGEAKRRAAYRRRARPRRSTIVARPRALRRCSAGCSTASSAPGRSSRLVFGVFGAVAVRGVGYYAVPARPRPARTRASHGHGGPRDGAGCPHPYPRPPTSTAIERDDRAPSSSSGTAIATPVAVIVGAVLGGVGGRDRRRCSAWCVVAGNFLVPRRASCRAARKLGAGGVAAGAMVACFTCSSSSRCWPSASSRSTSIEHRCSSCSRSASPTSVLLGSIVAPVGLTSGAPGLKPRPLSRRK